MSKKWFFKRGNARVSWETAPDWAQFVSVDEDGMVLGRDTKPARREACWLGYNRGEIIAHVGHPCQDWHDLLFERPLITAEEWRAIRVVFPGTRAIAKDENGSIWAYLNTPHIGFASWVGIVGPPVYFSFLRDRFADIPWRESLVEYDGDR